MRKEIRVTSLRIEDKPGSFWYLRGAPATGEVHGSGNLNYVSATWVSRETGASLQKLQQWLDDGDVMFVVEYVDEEGQSSPKSDTSRFNLSAVSGVDLVFGCARDPAQIRTLPPDSRTRILDPGQYSWMDMVRRQQTPSLTTETTISRDESQSSEQASSGDESFIGSFDFGVQEDFQNASDERQYCSSSSTEPSCSYMSGSWSPASSYHGSHTLPTEREMDVSILPSIEPLDQGQAKFWVWSQIYEMFYHREPDGSVLWAPKHLS